MGIFFDSIIFFGESCFFCYICRNGTKNIIYYEKEDTFQVFPQILRLSEEAYKDVVAEGQKGIHKERHSPESSVLWEFGDSGLDYQGVPAHQVRSVDDRQDRHFHLVRRLGGPD